MAKKTVEDIEVKGKRVLCRVDFNVPLTEDMKVADDKRIVAAMPTIQYLLDHKAKVILCSHLGRPKGKVDMKYTLAPVAARLGELLPGVRVQFASDTVGESAKACVADMKDGEIVLLENTRFRHRTASIPRRSGRCSAASSASPGWGPSWRSACSPSWSHPT